MEPLAFSCYLLGYALHCQTCVRASVCVRVRVLCVICVRERGADLLTRRMTWGLLASCCTCAASAFTGTERVDAEEDGEVRGKREGGGKQARVREGVCGVSGQRCRGREKHIRSLLRTWQSRALSPSLPISLSAPAGLVHLPVSPSDRPPLMAASGVGSIGWAPGPGAAGTCIALHACSVFFIAGASFAACQLRVCERARMRGVRA